MPIPTITDAVQRNFGTATMFRYELTEKSHLSSVTRSIVAIESAGHHVDYFTRNENGVMVVYSDITL